MTIIKNVAFELCVENGSPIHVKIVDDGAGEFYKICELEPYGLSSEIHLVFEEVEAIYKHLKKLQKNEKARQKN